METGPQLSLIQQAEWDGDPTHDLCVQGKWFIHYTTAAPGTECAMADFVSINWIFFSGFSQCLLQRCLLVSSNTQVSSEMICMLGNLHAFIVVCWNKKIKKLIIVSGTLSEFQSFGFGSRSGWTELSGSKLFAKVLIIRKVAASMDRVITCPVNSFNLYFAEKFQI